MLFLGDIVGNCGRDAVVRIVPELRDELALDYVVANGENITGGRGITEKHAEQLFDCGIDIITGGNHTFQHRDVYQYLDSTGGITRPLNYPPGAPGHGVAEVGNLTVINVIGRAFMGADYDDPFARWTKPSNRWAQTALSSWTCTPKQPAKSRRWAGFSMAA